MATILKEIIGEVLVLKLNRPDKFNSFNKEMALLMQSILEEAAADKAIRAIYITGEGKAFCAGQDLAEAIDSNGPGIEKIVTGHYNPIIRFIRSIEKPVICAVNGVAAGAGANIALACDIVVGSENASFIQAFSKIGLIPDSGGTFFLPRIIGLQRATALMFTGEKVSAQDALNFGMIYKIFPDDSLFNNGLDIARQLSKMPTLALGLTKKLLNQSFYTTYENQLQEEAKAQVTAAKSDDYKEGVNAFLEKRKPIFKGN